MFISILVLYSGNKSKTNVVRSRGTGCSIYLAKYVLFYEIPNHAMVKVIPNDTIRQVIVSLTLILRIYTDSFIIMLLA